MKNAARNFWLVLATAVALILAALALLPRLLDVERFRGLIETRAEEALGREVWLGQIDLSLLPLALTLDDVAVGALPGEGEGEILKAERLEVGARLRPLLRGRLEVTGIVVERPTMLLARGADGEWNVSRLVARAGGAAAAGDPAAAEEGRGASGVEVTGLEVRDGRIAVRDHAREGDAPVELVLSDLDLVIRGTVPERFDVAGTVELERPRGGDGGDPPPALPARFDLAVAKGGDRLELRALELGAGGTPLTLGGTVERVAEGRRFDLELPRTELDASALDDLLRWLAGDARAGLETRAPVAVEARIEGVVAAGAPLPLEARLELRRATLRHPALAAPLESLDADVAVDTAGESLRLSGLSARLGASELAGEVAVEGWRRPRARFVLRSPRAELGELFAVFQGDSPDGSSAGSADGGSALDTLSAEGELRVDAGTWDDLAFRDLVAELRLADGVATLDPLEMALYDGTFAGRVTVDLRVSPPAFALEGEAERVDVAPFLADNLEVEELLDGRFSGRIEARGRGSDYETIVRSLEGGGTARVDEGRLARLGVLRTVAEVAGVLGQRTLAEIADRAASDWTRFQRLEGRFRLAGGKLELERLDLETIDFLLQGRGLVDLLGALLDGDFRLAFSPELSERMRREGSRAAELFWNPDSGRVTMPLRLEGPFDDPEARVEWDAALQGYATRRLADELLDLIGGGRDDPLPSSGDPPATGTGDAPATGDSPGTGDAPDVGDALPSRASGAGLEVAITRVRWGGSFLLQDLRIEGELRGAGIAGASLRAVDTAGRTVYDKPLAEVAERLAADPASPLDLIWRAEIDGKRLVLAELPLVLTVTVRGEGGESIAAGWRVER